MKFSLYWSYATRSLWRGGQRTLLALFCVAVGVMAIIALQLVGLSVNQALLGTIVQANGGDMRLSATVAPLRQSDLAFLDALRQRGEISAYATSYNPGGSITLPDGGEAVFALSADSPNFPLVGQANFILPSTDLTIQSVLKGQNAILSSSVFEQLGARIGSTYRVKTLDGRVVPITVAAEIQEDGNFRGPQVLIAQSALNAAPGPQGQPLPAKYDTVYITVPAAQLAGARAQLSLQFPGLRITTADDLLRQRQAQVDQIRLFLRIVGLLALFIGGIGIINTMQVLLRRRQVEIATLKTTGYRRRDLYALFGLEAALLGLLGGLLGTLLGLGASYLVRVLVEQAFLIQLPLVLDPLTIASGLIIGLATALIFGLLPIVQASHVRPLAVLRELIEERQRGARVANFSLLLLLSLLFVFLAAAILGDVVTALIAVYGGALLIFALTGGFGLLVLLISRLPVRERFERSLLVSLLRALGLLFLTLILCVGLIVAGRALSTWASARGHSTEGAYLLTLPGGVGLLLFGGALIYLLTALLNTLVVFLPSAWKTTLMFAYRNLGRQRLRTAATLSALFVGVFAIGLILVLGQGIKDTIDSTLSTLFTHNVFIAAPPAQASLVNQQLKLTRGIDTSKTQMNPVVPQLYPILVNGQDINALLRSAGNNPRANSRNVLGNLGSMEGYDLAGGGANLPDVSIQRGRNLRSSDAGSPEVLLNAQLEQSPLYLHVGDTLELQSSDGSVILMLTVAGFYTSDPLSGNTNFASILADTSIAQRLGGASTLDIYELKIDPAQVPALRKHLSQAAPGALMFSVADIATEVNQLLSNLVVMLTTISSLAMIAGLIIMANAVALAMLERRREIGILKAVGHTSRSILAMVLLENGLVGLLGALLAMLLAVGAVVALSMFVFNTDLHISSGLVSLIILATICLTMLVAWLVAWRAVRVRPLDVLRYE